MASVIYGKCYLWQMYYGKCNYGKNIYGKNIMANETEPAICRPETFLDICYNNCQLHSFLVIIAPLPLSEKCDTIINDPIKFVFNFHKVLVFLTTNFSLNLTFLIYNNYMFISGCTEVFTCFIRCTKHQSVQYITFFNICNSEIENF